jgi:regulatory protein
MPDSTSPVTTPDEESLDATVNSADIRLAAMNLLARREHSVRELRNKLLRRFPDEERVDEQVSRLTAERLQCDVRFAESYARQRISRGYGPLRLREELRERGVSEADAALAMDELEADWHALAAEVMQKKFGALPPADIREEARRARFMQYRGFAVDHYRRIRQD